MEFDKGMAGVLVVVLSLIASVGLGVITNIDTTTVSKDVDEYVADITGGFNSQKEKSYIDYNPSKNYNGYVNQTDPNKFAVDFEPTGYVNNYPMSYTLSSINSTTYTKASDIGVFTQADYNYRGFFPGYDNRDFSENRTDENGGYLFYTSLEGPITSSTSVLPSPKYIYYYPLKTALESFITDGTSLMGVDPTTITITINYTVKSVMVPYLSDPSLPQVKYYYLDNNLFVFNPSSPYTEYYDFRNLFNDLSTYGEDATLQGRLEYTLPSASNPNGIFSMYYNDVLKYSGDPTNYQIVYGDPGIERYSYSRYSSVNTIQTYDWVELYTSAPTHPLTVTYEGDTVRSYMDTRYGVGIWNDDTIIWSNGESNGVIDLTFSVWNGSTKTFEDTGVGYQTTGAITYLGTSAINTLTVSRIGGYTYISLDGGSPINIGTWNQVMVRIDAVAGKITAIPIISWQNFNNYNLYTTSVDIGTIPTTNNISSITWTATNSLRLQITNTQVFYNTYGVIMIDPDITISNLWPNYDRFVVSIDNVATVGTSVTIGNQNYPISSNHINVNGTSIDVTDMDIRYTYDDDNGIWNVEIESDGNTAEITASNTYLKLTGSWYFVAKFYQTTTKYVTERVWNPGEYNWFESHMFFWMAGFVLLLGLGAYKLGYLDGISILIIIASELILIIIGGVS